MLAGHAGHRRAAAAGRTASRAAGAPRGRAAPARPAAPPRRRRGGRACSPATGPASAAAARRWAAGACGAAAAAAAGARRCAGTGRRRSASRRRPGRRSRRPTARPAPAACRRSRSDASARPCTSCSSWTANSTSRRPPRPSLSSRSACGRRDVRLDPAAHRLHLGDEAGPVAGLPDQRPERVDVGAAQGGVAGDRAHLQQRLELPGARPLLVVGARGRPRVRTSAPALPSGRSAASTSQAASRQIRIRAAATRVGGGQGRRLGVARVDRLGHEDDVDVADVVQLPAAALAQRRSRPAGRRRRRRAARRRRRPARR